MQFSDLVELMGPWDDKEHNKQTPYLARYALFLAGRINFDEIPFSQSFYDWWKVYHVVFEEHKERALVKCLEIADSIRELIRVYRASGDFTVLSFQNGRQTESRETTFSASLKERVVVKIKALDEGQPFTIAKWSYVSNGTKGQFSDYAWNMCLDGARSFQQRAWLFENAKRFDDNRKQEAWDRCVSAADSIEEFLWLYRQTFVAPFKEDKERLKKVLKRLGELVEYQ